MLESPKPGPDVPEPDIVFDGLASLVAETLDGLHEARPLLVRLAASWHSESARGALVAAEEHLRRAWTALAGAASHARAAGPVEKENEHDCPF
jgi:hypothetical protein